MKKTILIRFMAALLLTAFISGPVSSYAAEDEKEPEKTYQKPAEKECRSLDIVEFGLIEDGFSGEPWSEYTLVEKYGPPCQVLYLGTVYVERRFGRIIEFPGGREEKRITGGEYLEKKQFIYKGDYTNRPSIITIVGGVVTKKERIYD